MNEINNLKQLEVDGLELKYKLTRMKDRYERFLGELEMNCHFGKKSDAYKEVVPFDFNALKEYLEKKYNHNGHFMMMILDIFVSYRRQHKDYEAIFLSYANIADMIGYGYNIYFNSMEITRRIDILIKEGVIEKVQKPGWRAGLTKNGYQFLPWEPGKNNLKKKKLNEGEVNDERE